MILVNLLPEEYLETKISFRIPFQRIYLALSVLLLILWGFVLIRSGQFKKSLSHIETELKSLYPNVAQAEQVTQEMNQDIIPKKTFLDSLERPEVQWDHVMNLISDALPDGVWLSSLTLTEIPDFSIRMEGFAEAHKEKSAISLVGDFVTQLKKKLEDLVAPTQQVPQGGPTPPTLRAETFTQQKETGPTKLTQFIVEWRKK